MRGQLHDLEVIDVRSLLVLHQLDLNTGALRLK